HAKRRRERRLKSPPFAELALFRFRLGPLSFEPHAINLGTAGALVRGGPQLRDLFLHLSRIARGLPALRVWASPAPAAELPIGPAGVEPAKTIFDGAARSQEPNFLRVVANERRLTCEYERKDAPQPKHITSAVDILNRADRLFWRHESRRAEDTPGLRLAS